MMQQKKPQSQQRYLWPALALIVGATLGMLFGLLISMDMPAIGAALGAGLGLIAGAIIDLLTWTD